MPPIVPPWRDVKPSGYYVYSHRLGNDAHPFYIGKGVGKRGWAINSSRSQEWNSHCKGKIVNISIIMSGMNEGAAFDLEISLISKYRSQNISLLNKTKGGEGPSGCISCRKVAVFSSLRERFDSITEAVLYLRNNGYPTAVGSNIGGCAKGRHEFMYGRAWSTNGFPPHPESTDVKQAIAKSNVAHSATPVWSSSDGRFDSISSAVSFLRQNGYPRASQGTLSRAVRTNTVAYDRMWSVVAIKRYKCKSSKESWFDKVSKSIVASNGMKFSCLKDAEKWLRNNGHPIAGYHGISKCCNGKQKTAYGLEWRFDDDDNLL